MIAMALVCRPSLLIADEPTTALDVTIQAQILALIKELQAELDMAVLIITHDLGVVANVAEEVVVLYEGRVMEQGTIAALFERPTHPYLQGAAARRAAFRHEARRAPRVRAHRSTTRPAPLVRSAGAVARRCRRCPPRRAQRQQDVPPARRRASSAHAQGPGVPRRRRRELHDPRAASASASSAKAAAARRRCRR